jgi:hypothetical protein
VNSNSDTRELFVRTHFSQWLVAEQEPKSDDIAKLTILPKSIGREGSLLDADGKLHLGIHNIPRCVFVTDKITDSFMRFAAEMHRGR